MLHHVADSSTVLGANTRMADAGVCSMSTAIPGSPFPLDQT